MAERLSVSTQTQSRLKSTNSLRHSGPSSLKRQPTALRVSSTNMQRASPLSSLTIQCTLETLISSVSGPYTISPTTKRTVSTSTTRFVKMHKSRHLTSRRTATTYRCSFRIQVKSAMLSMSCSAILLLRPPPISLLSARATDKHQNTRK